MEETSIPAPWLEINQAELDVLRNASIKLSDTAHGRFEEQKKIDVEQACTKMSAKDKETLKWRIAKIDEAGASIKESTQPNLTPV